MNLFTFRTVRRSGVKNNSPAATGHKITSKSNNIVATLEWTNNSAKFYCPEFSLLRADWPSTLLAKSQILPMQMTTLFPSSHTQ